MIKEGAWWPKSQATTLKCYCPIEQPVLWQPPQEEEGPFPPLLGQLEFITKTSPVTAPILDGHLWNPDVEAK